MPTLQLQTDRGFHIRLTGDTAAQGPGISVHEEDNYGLLSSPPQVSLPIIVHPLRLYTELYDFSPYKVGSLRIRENKILAIVVDVEQEPPCKPEWVREALEHILEHAAEVRAPALNLPLLGNRYGKLQVDACLELTVEALLTHRHRLQSRISLCMDRQHMARAYRKLAASGLMENRVYPLFRS